MRDFPPIARAMSVRIATDRETGKPRGFCHVEYNTQDEAEAALQAIDDMGGLEIEGRSIGYIALKAHVEKFKLFFGIFG